MVKLKWKGTFYNRKAYYIYAKRENTYCNIKFLIIKYENQQKTAKKLKKC